MSNPTNRDRAHEVSISEPRADRMGDDEQDEPHPASAESVAALLWKVGLTDTLTMGTETFARSPHPIRKTNPEWWKDVRRKYVSMSLPIYALRDEGRPGIGKFTDLGRLYRDMFARQGIDTLVLLPPFQSTHISPYSPVSAYALNELFIDWTCVTEVCEDQLLKLTRTREDPRSVHYADELDRAEKLRLAAYRKFSKSASAFRRSRFREFIDNQQRNRNWLEEYVWFLTERGSTISDPYLANQSAESHMFAQWLAYNQFKDAIDSIHAAGGHIVIDIPLFRACDGADMSRHSEYFRDGHPGAGGQIWGDLSLWNWDKLRSEGSQYLLDPTEHWLDFGCDGARVDAVANAFKRDGQFGGGDEQGERFIADLARVFRDRDALPLVEVLSAPSVTDAVEGQGLLALYRDWQVYSTHDFVNIDLSQDPRNLLDEVRHLLRDSGDMRGWKGALFVNITFLDVEGDPYKVKRVEHADGQTRSTWDTQMSLPSDLDYRSRARWDRGFSLACIVREETGRKLASESGGGHQFLLPRVSLTVESTYPRSDGPSTSRVDLSRRPHDKLLVHETNAYLTRGTGFEFQHQGYACSGWGGFQAALSTVPDSVVACHLAAKDIERYVNYVVRLVPQAETIQAWVNATLGQVHTPHDFRAWARQFEDELRTHARRRVESWRRHDSGGFTEVPKSARLHESQSGILADNRSPPSAVGTRILGERQGVQE